MASRLSAYAGLIAAAALACGRPQAAKAPAPTYTTPAAAAAWWNNATVYFLLTDRFQNGDPSNDQALGRQHDGALLRNFEGGDLAGVLQQVEAGYFDSLGVTAIWLTPFVEQIHAGVDEGTGKTYGFHGYWTRDWTQVDPALGTKALLRQVVEAAHHHGMKVLMDAVINHPGPVTPLDPAWPESWVRTTPQCKYQDYASTTECTLVPSLPDVRTDSDTAVALPGWLTDKWKQEGRLEQEQASLDAFFRRTGYPRAPRFYIIKWLTDWVRDCGFDGYRVDTAKHFGLSVSGELRHEADLAYADWKAAHRAEEPDSLPFYMVGEVYGWEEGGGRPYDYGDRKVDFFSAGYDALINFGFKRDAAGDLETAFSRYAESLRTGALKGVALLNYASSHDDGGPLDPDRHDPLGTGTRLLLAPGGAQIYYGDELARPLKVPGAQGDANLRSLMNWADRSKPATRAVLDHWRKLGEFRRKHPAIGSGDHRRLQATPYVFSRTLKAGGRADKVVIALDQPAGARTIPVADVFPEGTLLLDSYSGVKGTVHQHAVALASGGAVVLLSEPQ
jgi:alpha-amylase